MMKKIYYEKGENYNINKDKMVNVFKYDVSNDIEITDISNITNKLKNAIKISKEEYFDIREGITKRYRSSVLKSKECLRKSMKNLERKIRNNFKGDKNELFITLTAEDTLSFLEIEKAFDEFWSRLKLQYADLEYIYVFENHNYMYDDWHLHVLIKAIQHKTLYIPNEIIEKLWQKGFTKTSRISEKSKNNNINEKEHIEYVKKVLIKEEEFGIEKVISYMTKTKSKEKIPKWSKSYKSSRGMKSPKKNKGKYSKVCEKIDKDYRLNKEETILVKDIETNKILNKIKRETWKKDKDNKKKK